MNKKHFVIFVLIVCFVIFSTMIVYSNGWDTPSSSTSTSQSSTGSSSPSVYSPSGFSSSPSTDPSVVGPEAAAAAITAMEDSSSGTQINVDIDTVVAMINSGFDARNIDLDGSPINLEGQTYGEWMASGAPGGPGQTAAATAILAAITSDCVVITPNGYQLPAGSTALPKTCKINAHSVCRVLTNTGTNNYFVPVKEANEWASFRDNSQSGVSKLAC